MSDGTTEELLKKQNWFHSYEVLPGVWTPGRTGRLDAREILTHRHGLPENLKGVRALDIGALDGPYTFDLERRGATVTAIDIQSPDVTGFNVAKKLKGSGARYIQGNVYDLVDIFPTERFDIVLFFGVWYHLKNPFRAFDQINRISAKDATLCAEGECLLSYAEVNGREVKHQQPFVNELAQSKLPVHLWYPRGFKGDAWTWCVPNAACVKAWIDAAAFDLEAFGHTTPPDQRMYFTATKSDRQVVVDNPVW